ncbi:VanZ family protein [Metabacillus sp. GX 13764]|uniref:VanZ family protein n=1 Tax=Metabacillus kandeliae TaxID=2900151 RepID=UPI001E5266FF|nr:VanZ family protein [Metabacillus kandeliae]
MKKYWVLLIPLIYGIPGALIDFRNKMAAPDFGNSHYVIGELLNICLIIGTLSLFIRKTTVKSNVDWLLLAVFAFYYVQLFGNTVSFPFASVLDHPFRGESLFAEGVPVAINAVPAVLTIKTILEPGAVTLLVGNALMLTPMAFCMLYFGWMKSAGKTAAAMILASISIELIQLAEMTVSSFFYIRDMRTADIDDVILNSFSGFLGVWLFTKFQKTV